MIDCDPSSATYGKLVGWSELPTAGNELHHFGWNACSSALCHQGHGDHGGPLERRYLIVPGIRSSRTYVLDTKPDPRNPRVVRTIEAEELAAKAGYSRPHTIHCGPGGIFMFALGGADGNDGPGGVALLDHDSFEVIGAWELDRGDQFFGYDGWWHLNYDTVITSEWATPSMVENGLNPEDLLGRKFGHLLNFWSMSQRKLTQRVDLGDQHQMVFEVRPAHDPSKAWGFVGVVISVEDLSGSVWLWHRDGDRWAVRKVVTIPAEPADPEQLPPALQPFGAVPPLVSDIDLSVDDRWLYVSCWGTGELKQYDVSDPFNPHETGSVRLGGIVRRRPHPAAPDRRLGGGPQMVEVSRDGKRVYVTNSIYGAWDDIFYPDGVGAWMAKLDADTDRGGIAADPRFFPNGDDFRGCGCTRPGSRQATPPATPAATPAESGTMSETGLFTRPGLDQTIPVVAVLGSLAAAAWAMLAGGTVGHASHEVVLGSGQLPRLGTLVAFLGNWQVMVVATMLPPAIPAVAAGARRTQRWWATTGAVMATTCAVWTGFAVAMLAGDSVVHRLVAAWPWLGNREWLLTSAMLVLAGTVHLAPFERRALAAARSVSSPPWRYAITCLGSCWALMLVMFAVGVESLLWMVLLATVMTVERVARCGSRLAPPVGLALISVAVMAPLHTGGLL